ncbi:MAG: hypothetical protein DRP09_18980 [Candidatus Thorarchaeota archaeon]|nr:MAG: hypothetical protein DRP09_18980 [Candidatus Thorarchaeota archaeon]
MENPIIYVYRANPETIKLTLIDGETNRGMNLTGVSSVKFRVVSKLNEATSYIVDKTCTVTDATEGEFECTLASNDFTSVGDYYYGIFLDDVLVAQGQLVVTDSVIVST